MIGFGFWSIIILTSHFTLSCSERTQKTRSFWTAIAGRVKITRSPPNKLVNISDKDQACMGWGSILVRGSGFECCPQSFPATCVFDSYLPKPHLPPSLPPLLQHTFQWSSLSKIWNIAKAHIWLLAEEHSVTMGSPVYHFAGFKAVHGKKRWCRCPSSCNKIVCQV